MANILYTWEIGGGWGHVKTFAPIAAELTRRGHNVYAALKDMSRESAFEGAIIRSVQAPPLPPKASTRAPAFTLAQFWCNLKFDDAAVLQERIIQWQRIFESVLPDMVFCDHSPIALLALLKYRIKRILVGSSASCPPDRAKLSLLPDEFTFSPDAASYFERRMLEAMNLSIAGSACDPVERITEVYSRADHACLLTFPELDHFGSRGSGDYYGVWPGEGGKEICWPNGSGPRIFVYSDPFPVLIDLLLMIRKARFPTIVYGPGFDARFVKELRSSTMEFTSELLDLKRVAAECDLSINNGNHYTVGTLLLAGKPSLQIPFHAENYGTASITHRMGVGIMVASQELEPVVQSLDKLILSNDYHLRASEFAAKYDSFSSRNQCMRLVDVAEKCLR